MGERQRSILEAIAALGLAGGLFGALLGVLEIVASRGAGGFGGAIALGIGIGIVVLSAVAIVPALLLRRAVAELRSSHPHRVPLGVGGRLAWGVVTAAVLLVWLAPAVMTTVGGDAVPGLDRTLSIIGIGLGIVTGATAYASRALLDRPLGVLMLVVALLTVAIPAWESSLLLETQNRRTANEQAKRHFEERFAEILAGPTAAEIATAVGDVGEWRLLSSGVSPMLRADIVVQDPERIFEFAGQDVRFALVGQCTADFDGGQLVGYVDVFGQRTEDGNPLDSQYVKFPLVPCDGSVQGGLSDAVALPAWDATTLAGAVRRDWDLAAAAALVAPPATGRGSSSDFPDTGARWLIFGATEPAPSIGPLVEAAAAQLDPIRAR